MIQKRQHRLSKTVKHIDAQVAAAGKLYETQRYDQGEARFRDLVRQSPDHPGARVGHAMTLAALGRLGDAWESIAWIMSEARPIPIEVIANAGFVCLRTGRFAEGVQLLERVLTKAPGHLNAQLNLSAIYRELKRFDEAEHTARRLTELAPQFAGGWVNLANALLDTGRQEAAEVAFRRAIAIRPDFPQTWNNLFFCMTNNAARSARDIVEDARAFGKRFTRGAKPAKALIRDARARRLSIGFVSGDLRTHAVVYFLEPLLARLNREAFHVTLYSTHPVTDAVTERMRRYADRWVDVFSLSDDRMLERIAADRIDILIDLSGHSAANRLTVFGRRAAPVQATWLGFPGSTGLPTVDWRITDEMGDPSGQDEAYVERLWRLPDIFCVYRPSTRRPALRHALEYEVKPPPALANGFVTFGSCNNPAKISDATLVVWGRVLAEIPNARLLVEGKGFQDAKVRDGFLQRAIQAGIDPHRLDLVALDPRQQYLTYHRIDIALDTFPMTGGTTTFDALWMGVPVVTLAGNEFRKRLSATILHAGGMDKWVATSEAEYVQIAADLARLPVNARFALRMKQRQTLEASPAMEATRFAGAFGDALRGMWETCLRETGSISREAPRLAWETASAVHEPLLYTSTGRLGLAEAKRLLDHALVHFDDDEAIRLAEAILWETPRDAQALAALAELAFRKRRWPEFYAYQSHTIDNDPGNLEHYDRLLAVAVSQDNVVAVRGLLQAAPRIAPAFFARWSGLVPVFSDPAGNSSARQHAFENLGGRLVPEASESQTGLTQVLEAAYAAARSHRFTEAREHFAEATRLNPEHAKSWAMLCGCLVHERRFAEAVDAGERALALDTGDIDALNNLGIAYKGVGDLERTLLLQERATLMAPQHINCGANFMLNLLYAEGIGADDLIRRARKIVADWSEHPMAVASERPAGGRVRVVFLSPDFNSHPVMYSLLPLLQHMDRQRFELICVHTRALSDRLTDTVRQLADQYLCVADRYFPSAGGSADVLVRCLADLQPDVLIDLAGFTGDTGLPALASRIAPLQVTWLGYPGTTGLGSVDVRITDASMDPPGVSDGFYTEKLVRLPRVFCVYRPLAGNPLMRFHPTVQTRSTPALSKGFVTFGSVQKTEKISPACVRLWAQVLEAVPSARLLLEYRCDEQSHLRLKEKMAGQGLPMERVVWRDRKDSPQYVCYHDIDIVLDTFPMNGGVSTFDALWMGVPVVTLAGECGRSRLSTTLLSAAGLDAWVAPTEERYIRIAADLAGNITELNRLRMSLRRQIELGALHDERGFAQAFEQALLDELAARLPGRIDSGQKVESGERSVVIQNVEGTGYVPLKTGRDYAEKHLREARWKEAQRWLVELLAVEHRDPWVLDAMAEAAARLGERKDAIAYCAHALDLDFSSVQRVQRMVAWSLADGNVSLAKMVAQRFASLFPEESSAFKPLLGATNEQVFLKTEFWQCWLVDKDETVGAKPVLE